MRWGVSRDERERRSSASQAFYTQRACVDRCIDAILGDAERRPPPEAHCIVDMACGDNYFASELARRIVAEGARGAAPSSAAAPSPSTLAPAASLSSSSATSTAAAAAAPLSSPASTAAAPSSRPASTAAAPSSRPASTAAASASPTSSTAPSSWPASRTAPSSWPASTAATAASPASSAAGFAIVAYERSLPADALVRSSIVETDFMAVGRRALPVPPTVRGHCVLGYNPPFGARNERLRAFVEHAVTHFAPLRIYLVHQRRFYVPPGGYALRYQIALPRSAFYTRNGGTTAPRAAGTRKYGMYGCFFSIYVRAPGAPVHGLSGVTPPHGVASDIIEAIDSMRPLDAERDDLVLLRTGTRGGTYAYYVARARTSHGVAAHASHDSTVYYKIRLRPRARAAVAALDDDALDTLLARIVRACAADPVKGAVFPPYATRRHVARVLDALLGALVHRRRAPPGSCDIRSFALPTT